MNYQRTEKQFLQIETNINSVYQILKICTNYKKENFEDDESRSLIRSERY